MRVICVLALALSLALAARRNPGQFSKSFYQGPSYKSIIALYYKGYYKQPKCYATLINFDVAVGPCSCVIKQPNKNDLPTWWDHRIVKKVQADAPSNYKAIVMSHEYMNDSVKNMMMVPVKEISLFPKCDTLFQYNVARIVLQKPIGRTKIAWVASPFEDKMRDLLDHAMVTTAVRGSCFVYRWTVYEGPWWGGGKTPDPRIILYEVSFSQWRPCKDLVCSNKITPNNQTAHHNSNVCENKVSKSRICAIWEAALPFCAVVPGTPVFCSAGPMIGLAGFVHNATMWCPWELPMKFAVMEGIDMALPLIKYDMRLMNVLNKKLQ